MNPAAMPPDVLFVIADDQRPDTVGPFDDNAVSTPTTENLYEHSARVPLVITGPGVTSRESRTPCGHHDLFPTPFDLLNLDIPPSVTARSHAPAR